jgi:T5SS/PEP-CTERM-associated repeat protein
VAVVTGAGSVWSNRAELDIGFDSDGNRLVVSGGGVVLADLGVIGSGGFSNQALVTGPGTLWTNHTDLWVGAPGGGNLLVVSNGGRVFDRNGILGLAKGSPNNEAVVTGAGSLWSNRQHLVVGGFGDESRLTVMDGGTVFAGTNVSVGFNGGSVNNFLLLSSGALLTNNGNGIIGGENDANTNTVFITGAGTRWLMGNNLYVGSNGAFNQLVVSNGALLVNGNGHLGFRPASSNNVAVVTGAGSVWSNRAELDIGFDSDGNRLVVSSGGVVMDDLGVTGRK